MPYPYNVEDINRRAISNPSCFASECEAIFNRKVNEAAALIAERSAAANSHVVLLSGPSGSGKTTTAKKICAALKGIGIHAHTVSLDKYYLTPSLKTSPLTEGGEIDLESPYCLDLKLLNEHFHRLNAGDEVVIPHFSFKMQSRDPEKAMSLRLKNGEIVIFEGIHALNDMLTAEHPNATKIYISARSDVQKNGELCFKRTWTRILRRVVRDSLFRGIDVTTTLTTWATVRRGEKEYISPFKYKADLLFDSSMEYEIPVMKRFALNAFGNIPEDMERSEEIRARLPILAEIEEMDPAYVPQDSILREFIGGGLFEY
jgi:uridine kinase